MRLTPPQGFGQAVPPGRPAGADCGHVSVAPAARGDRRATALVYGGSFVSVLDVCGARARWRSPHRSDRLAEPRPVASRHRGRRAGLRAGPRPARAVGDPRVHGGRASPYDVLSKFSETVTGPDDSTEVPARMAQVLAEGTGAQWTQVWLVDDDGLCWRPPGHRKPVPGTTGRTATSPACDRSTSRSTVCGSASCGSRSARTSRLSPVEERLFADLAAQAGLVLHGAAAARRAGEAGRGPGDPGRGPPGRRADVSSTPTTPNGGG